MSTYVHLACLDHDPPLLADAESDQHRHKDGVMERIRSWVEQRDVFIELYLEGNLDPEYFLANSVRFLASHRGCRIAARDENDVWLDLGQGIPAYSEAPSATPKPGPTDPGLLTPDEHRAVAMAGELWGLLCKITTTGLARQGDLAELIAHIHAIQRTVLKQAAARAYPELYRLLGGDPPPLPAGEWPDAETVTEQQPPRPPARPALLSDPVIPSS